MKRECLLHAPKHEHHEGMNECSICDEGVPCANCGHAHLHGLSGCWGCIKEHPDKAICKAWVKPACTCSQKTLDARAKADEKHKQCPKCGYWSGDDWSQCKGSCPMPGSPHYNLQEWLKRHPDPEHLLP